MRGPRGFGSSHGNGKAWVVQQNAVDTEGNTRRLHSYPAGNVRHHPRLTAPMLSIAGAWRASWLGANGFFRAGPIMWGRFQLTCCRHRYQDALTTPSPRGSGPPPPPMDAPRGRAVDCRSLARKLTWGVVFFGQGQWCGGMCTLRSSRRREHGVRVRFGTFSRLANVALRKLGFGKSGWQLWAEK